MLGGGGRCPAQRVPSEAGASPAAVDPARGSAQHGQLCPAKLHSAGLRRPARALAVHALQAAAGRRVQAAHRRGAQLLTQLRAGEWMDAAGCRLHCHGLGAGWAHGRQQAMQPCTGRASKRRQRRSQASLQRGAGSTHPPEERDKAAEAAAHAALAWLPLRRQHRHLHLQQPFGMKRWRMLARDVLNFQCRWTDCRQKHASKLHQQVNAGWSDARVGTPAWGPSACLPPAW